MLDVEFVIRAKCETWEASERALTARIETRPSWKMHVREKCMFSCAPSNRKYSLWLLSSPDWWLLRCWHETIWKQSSSWQQFEIGKEINWPETRLKVVGWPWLRYQVWQRTEYIKSEVYSELRGVRKSQRRSGTHRFIVRIGMKYWSIGVLEYEHTGVQCTLVKWCLYYLYSTTVDVCWININTIHIYENIPVVCIFESDYGGRTVQFDRFYGIHAYMHINKRSTAAFSSPKSGPFRQWPFYTGVFVSVGWVASYFTAFKRLVKHSMLRCNVP